MGDGNVKELIFATAARNGWTGLVVVDEAATVSDEDCSRFRFVVRVGFGQYFNPPRSPTELWEQPPNTVVVPLGLPSPQLQQGPAQRDGSKAARLRPMLDRRYAWSFLGRVQNLQRSEMLENMLTVPGEYFRWDLHNLSWAEGLANGLPPADYATILADSRLAPSPVGNSHPECYRTYEALQAGALPLVDTDYYWVVFRAPFFQVNSDWNMSDIVDMISAPGGWELLETYRLRSTPLFSLASFSLSLSRTWPVRALT